MTKPTIHLNGTSRKDLAEGYEAAFRAVTDAAEALTKSCPNGRDYYPQGSDAFDAAVKEHRARREKLESVKGELMELWEAVCE